MNLLENAQFHSKVKIPKKYGGGFSITYIADNSPIPPDATSLRFYANGEKVTEYKFDGKTYNEYHDHKSNSYTGSPAINQNGELVGSSMPTRTEKQ